jgi:DNA invertase Pin-like site-specific DNA recombinase
VTAAKTPKRAVGYCRISVDRENETSTETQEKAIRDYCASKGWQVVDVIVEKGRSGYKASAKTRPGFTRALELIDSGAANALVIWKLDRAGRKVSQLAALIDDLHERGIGFVSITEGFDTSTAPGRMTAQMLGSVAEMESAQKSDRFLAWQDHRRTAGAPPAGHRIFGYRRERNQLLIDESEAAVLRKAADRVLAGDTLRSIARDLAASGVIGTGGQPINRMTLRQMLLNPAIAACREVPTDSSEFTDKGRFKRGTGALIPSDAWQPIIDQADWAHVCSILTAPNRRSGPGNRRRWWLSGIARCGRCSTAEKPVFMGAITHNSGRRYCCPVCYLSVEVARTDAHLEGLLLALLSRKAWRALRQGRAVGEADGLDEALDELAARWKVGEIDGAEMDRLADALRREAAASPPPTLPDVEDVAKAWPKLDLDARRLVLTAATESLTILPSQGVYGFDDTRIKWVSAA